MLLARDTLVPVPALPHSNIRWAGGRQPTVWLRFFVFLLLQGGSGADAHWRTVLLLAPQIVVFQFAVVEAMTNHSVRCGRKGVGLAGSLYSSDAINIHLTLHIFPRLWEAYGGPVRTVRIS